MLSKNEIKDIQTLSLKKYRDERGLFIAEGPKVVTELLQSAAVPIQKIYATQHWLLQNKSLTGKNTTQVITPNEMARITGQQTPAGVLAVIKKLPSKKPDIKNGFALYLDTVQDPGNMGTIIRIADWFGVKHIVCSQGCADLYNSKVVQSTMGSIGRVNVWTDTEESWLSEQTVPVMAATLQGRSIFKQKKQPAGVLVIGNESKGVRPAFIQIASVQLTIPKRGEAESLNAAVAAGILLSHLVN